MTEGNPSATSFFKFQAFTTAAVQDARIRTRMKAAMAGNLRRGEGARSFSKVVDAEFGKAGMTRLSPSAITNIYETNVSLAYGAGQMQKMLEVADDFPYWRYSATMDGKTRPTHAALHGKIFKVGDFTFFPPVGFRCRCTAIPMTARQAGRYLQSDMPDADGKKKLYNTLESKEFAGNKQQKFMDWTAREYAKADPYTRRNIDKAFEVMKEEIRTLEYESAKEFFRDDYVKKVEKEFLTNKKVQAAADQAGITKAEAFRVFAYTDFKNKLSADMARLHYTDQPLQQWNKNKLLTFKKDLSKALEKLPKTKGTVYRNLTGVPEEVLQQWTKKGAIIVWDGFSSTTKDAEVYKNRKVRLIIKTQTARDVESISKHPEEQEAILLPGAKLKVVEAEETGNQTVIIMKEV